MIAETDKEFKVCSICRENKPVSEFWADKGKPDGLRYFCKPCYLIYQRKYSLTWRYKQKLDALSYYCNGKPQCIKCGYDDIRALSIDHIKGGGRQHRISLKIGSGSHFYQWLKQNYYPNGFQVLCMNCQFIKRCENHETDKLEKMTNGI